MSPTRFVTARYGNVVGSTGSVIPMFKRQIKEFDEVRVTDSRMTRFWLSVDSAIDLILFSREKAEEFPGHTFISACPAMSIVDLASAVWVMERNRDPGIKIQYIGIRPGEKLHESLYNEQESHRICHIDSYDSQKIFVMAPVTRGGVWENTQKSYDSNHPNHWLTFTEMSEMIRDAETI